MRVFFVMHNLKITCKIEMCRENKTLKIVCVFINVYLKNMNSEMWVDKKKFWNVTKISDGYIHMSCNVVTFVYGAIHHLRLTCTILIGFSVRVFSFLWHILCYLYFGTFLSTWYPKFAMSSKQERKLCWQVVYPYQYRKNYGCGHL